MIWRMGKGTEGWHCCARCSRWPLEGYVEVQGPPAGPICHECLSENPPRSQKDPPRRLLHINMQLGGRPRN
jgi:hypothetical protein